MSPAHVQTPFFSATCEIKVRHQGEEIAWKIDILLALVWARKWTSPKENCTKTSISALGFFWAKYYIWAGPALDCFYRCNLNAAERTARPHLATPIWIFPGQPENRYRHVRHAVHEATTFVICIEKQLRPAHLADMRGPPRGVCSCVEARCMPRHVWRRRSYIAASLFRYLRGVPMFAVGTIAWTSCGPAVHHQQWVKEEGHLRTNQKNASLCSGTRLSEWKARHDLPETPLPNWKKQDADDLGEERSWQILKAMRSQTTKATWNQTKPKYLPANASGPGHLSLAVARKWLA